MRTGKLVCVVLCGGVLAAVAGRGFAGDQDKKKDAHDPMMEAMMKYGTPGEQHQYFEPLIGTFKIEGKWRTAPDAEWETFSGKLISKWTLGNRFVEQNVVGDPMEEGGPAFEGRGFLGYDIGRKKYTSIWMDNHRTGTMFSDGMSDASGKVFTYECDYFCPMVGGMKHGKQVIRIINNNKNVYESYDRTADGKEFVAMEITYTRT